MQIFFQLIERRLKRIPPCSFFNSTEDNTEKVMYRKISYKDKSRGKKLHSPADGLPGRQTKRIIYRAELFEKLSFHGNTFNPLVAVRFFSYIS